MWVHVPYKRISILTGINSFFANKQLLYKRIKNQQLKSGIPFQIKKMTGNPSLEFTMLLSVSKSFFYRRITY